MNAGPSGGWRWLSLLAQIAAAAILLQTLYFKLTGAPESIYIFERLGVEPWGRYATAVIELVTGIALLVPATAAMGAVLGMGVMAGALFSHLTVLGINVQGDGGSLFALAVLVFVCCALVAWLRRRQLPVVGRRFE